MGKILIIEDDFDSLSLIKFVLDEGGGRHTIFCANDGAEALEKLGVVPADEQADLPDLIVLDIMMPQVDGYSVIQQLASNPRTRAIPILVLTAKHKLRDVIMQSSNVAGYVDKPYDAGELRQMVSRILAAKNPSAGPPKLPGPRNK